MSITRVQGLATSPSTGGTSFTGGLTAGVHQGNLLVATVGVGNNATTVTGPAGWTQAEINQPAGSNATIQTSIWWTVVSAGQNGQASWTWTLSAAHTCYITIAEWNSTNGWPVNPVDVTAKGDTAATPTFSVTILSGTAATTSQASELWIASLAYKNTAQSESAVTAGWTNDLESTFASNNTNTMLYNVVSATGAPSCQYSIPIGRYWAGCVVAFKDNPAGSIPQISTAPTGLTFAATKGGSNPASQSDTLSETAGVGTAWTSAISYTTGSGWLSISPTSGSLLANGNATITVSIALGSLASGVYTATVTFTATTGGDTATINVTLNVGVPMLAFSPNSLSFSDTVGGSSPATQTSALAETAGGPTAWTSSISYTGGGRSGWLSISPASGSLLAHGSTTITVTPVTGSLAIGTYTANIVCVATTGGNTAILSVTFTVLASTSFKVMLAGQDITNSMDQMTIDAIDALGQGAGAGASPTFQGRQGTIKFNTSLGPMNSAYGAGQTLPAVGGPFLVRQGEIVITDASSSVVWAGFATKLTDITTGQYSDHGVQPYTTIEGTDYDASLDRTIVNADYSALTDVQMIKQILSTYAPWVGQQLLPATGTFLFPVKSFRNATVQGALRTISGITGNMIWIGFDKAARYVPITGAATSTFGLSDQPDFLSTFPHRVQEFIVDDNSIINKVTFYGGRQNSPDFTQDVSPLANGNNKTFPLAYYPHPASDGKVHVTINGVEKTLGDVNGTGAANTLISAGGTAQVLLNTDAHAVTFDVAPAAGTTILIRYQYDFPLSNIVTDQASFRYFGAYFEGTITDSSVFDSPTAIQRSKVLLAQQNYGLVSLQIDCWKSGLRAGNVVNVVNAVRGINGNYLIQEVETQPLGGGNFVYHLTLGAWKWNLVDMMMLLAKGQALQDVSTVSEPSLLNIVGETTNVNIHSAWTSSATLHTSPYYARSAALADGHDSFPGFATISSNS